MKHEIYTIRGGIEGRERLRILARVMRPGTLQFFDRVGIGPGMHCLDAGCGGGDVSFDLAERVGKEGHVTGIDRDAAKIEMAKKEAADMGLEQTDFSSSDICDLSMETTYDVVYARFLLTHLRDPSSALRSLKNCTKPGGMILAEDIDFRGHFSWPENKALARYDRLYSEAVRHNGGDPDIGPKLPSLFREAGLKDIGMHVVQPAGITGEVKLIAAITMENIAGSVESAGLATLSEIQDIVQQLYDTGRDDHTVMSLPRIVQVWGKR